ncbi:hypothetical protein OIU76_025236 [Salix suchowensis]|nr:hypothetical protein OIU76_025236 [Salix suchowensis]KAJ6356718.1 hypothetical protein OIU78_004755 [Salix suchowensis]
MEQASASSSAKPLLLHPVTPTPIPPSRAHIATPSQSQTKKHLLFKDDTPLQSLTANTSAEPPIVIPLLDPSASTMPKEDDQPNTSAEPPDVIPLLDPNASTMPKEDHQPKKRRCP